MKLIPLFPFQENGSSAKNHKKPINRPWQKCPMSCVEALNKPHRLSHEIFNPRALHSYTYLPPRAGGFRGTYQPNSTPHGFLNHLAAQCASLAGETLVITFVRPILMSFFFSSLLQSFRICRSRRGCRARARIVSIHTLHSCYNLFVLFVRACVLYASRWV